MLLKNVLKTACLLTLLGAGVNGIPRQSAESPLVGVWQGTVHHPKMGDREFYFTIEKKDSGAFMAKVDIPAQKARNVPVNEVRFAPPDLILDLSSYGIVYEGRVNGDFSLIQGRLKIGEEIVTLDLHRSAGVPDAARPQEPRKPYPYEEIEVRFPNARAGINLAGTLTMPPGPGPFPAAVLISGSGPQDRDSSISGHRPFLVLADALTRRGIAVLRSDDRGVMKSEGDFHRATTADFATDAQAAWEFLRHQPRIDAGKIGLVGHSEGAMIGSMVAAKNRDVSFLILLAGTGIPGERLALIQSRDISRSRGAGERAIEKETRLNERLFRVFKTQPDPSAAETEMRRIIADSLTSLSEAEKKELNVSENSLLTDMKGYLADYPWARFLFSYDPSADLRRITCPVLALNGGKDTQVSAGINLPAIEEAFRQGGNRRVEIKKLPGLNHLFQTAPTGHPREYGIIEETIAPSVPALIGDWILRTVRSS